MVGMDIVSVILTPFFVLAVTYTVAPPSPSRLAILLKCLPIVCLCGLVIAVTLGSATHTQLIQRYNTAVIVGLALSGIGDAALVYVDDQGFFILGLLFFALAHLSYIYAFGWKPVNIPLLFPCFILACIGYSLVYQGLAEHNLVFLGGLYTVLLMFIGWRALARARLSESRWTWTQLAAPLGALFFCFSDATLAMNKFYKPIPYSQTIVMSTYYAGQLGIALSVLGHDSKM
ncbi:lysoplasmalogenase-like protein TMEM86A [Strongylocentrotus purpuratus]|uniref:lysoplasmalogenase n=1 Tax=Strongylocentrotus purpuratus TaxID=7668 RepID=A0A7M7HNB7_STRPU|nr:lysoplasmalogenase-like protein TMEM86A [Strongylocentrotus purpuratus]